MWIITIIVTIQACSPRFGTYMSQMRHHAGRHGLQIREDSSYVANSALEWFSYRSFGTWRPIQGKQNHLSFKSSSSDYSHNIPIYVKESHSEKVGTIIIFTQGKQFYDCEFNEVLVNGSPIKIEQDTIMLSECSVDSLSIRLGYSEWMRRNLTATILYPAIYTQEYYPLDTTSNVYEITMPIYPHLDKISHPYATDLFSYVSEEFEAYYRCGKWYVGKLKIPYKRLKE